LDARLELSPRAIHWIGASRFVSSDDVSVRVTASAVVAILRTTSFGFALYKIGKASCRCQLSAAFYLIVAFARGDG
jgi:hypothetical protein